LSERYIAEQVARVSDGIDLTTKMLQRSRKQIVKSLDILRASKVPMAWHPEASRKIKELGND